MTFSTINLSLTNRPDIPIFIGYNILKESFKLLKINSKRMFIISQQQIFDAYGPSIIQYLEEIFQAQVEIILIKDGEQAKSLTEYQCVLDSLFSVGVERSDTIIGLGGGVVTDLAGFVAATCLRGISLIQCPTTLLCQVDAAIGGKTGINHDTGKNLIGSFYQPTAVICDLATLVSVSKPESLSGFAEVIKYGIISDVKLFRLLNESFLKIKQFNFQDDIKLWHSIVTMSCQNKVDVVQADEKESNLRAILNFGHTIGHGLEAYFNYSTYKHGECVAFGMVAATYIAEQKGLLASVVSNIYT